MEKVLQSLSSPSLHNRQNYIPLLDYLSSCLLTYFSNLVFILYVVENTSMRFDSLSNATSSSMENVEEGKYSQK